MKNQLPILLLQICLITLVSCNQSAEKYTQSVEEKVEKFEKKDKDLGKWLQELSAINPHTSEELIAKLPKNLSGFPLRSAGEFGVQTINGSYSMDKETNNESTYLKITLTDGAGFNGFQHVNAIYRMISMEIDNKEKSVWAKTLNHKGNRILLKEGLDKDTERSELEYIKDKRYHIILTGNRINSEQLLEAMDELEKVKF